MSRALAVDEFLACPLIGPGEATDRLLAVTAERYRVTSVAADSFELSRRYRPTWATVIGILLIPVLVGIALLVFVRRTERWTATVEADHRTTRVHVVGTVNAATHQALAEALAGPPSTAESKRFARPSTDESAVDRIATPTGVAESIRPAREWAPVAVGTPSGPGLRDAGAAPVDRGALIASVPVAPLDTPGQPAPPERRSSDATVARRDLAPSGGADRGSSVELVLDSGERWALSRGVVIGRAPDVPAEFAGASAVAVADSDRSVSKTHFGIRWRVDRGEVIDLGSTNGTRVIHPDGTAVAVGARGPEPVGPGCRVEFGDRWLTIEGGGDR